MAPAPATTGRRTHVVRTASDAAELGVLLGIWAHPDDEAYLSAGLMALALEAGSEVVCVTATRGESGSPDPGVAGSAKLARARSAELAASLACLGPIRHHWLGAVDGRCHLAPDAAMVERIAAILDEVRPDTVLTFGPDGFTGHLDHVAVGSWTLRALRQAYPTGAGPRVLWPCVRRSWVERYGELNRRFGVFGTDGPPVVDDADLAVVVQPGFVTTERKMAALRAHRSQTAELMRCAGPATYRRWWRDEVFIAA